jgi:hypothetical protein
VTRFLCVRSPKRGAMICYVIQHEMNAFRELSQGMHTDAYAMI